MSLDVDPLGDVGDADGESNAGGAARPDDAGDDVDALAASLGAAIAELPEYRAYERARRDVATDEELQEQIEAFEQRREAFAVKRQQGEATQTDVEELRAAQESLHADPTMSEFLTARDRLRDRLEAVNVAISEPLTIDFGGEAGGCCQD